MYNYDTRNFGLELAKGNIKDNSTQFKFSRSINVTATPTVIWDGGTDYTFIENAEQLEIASTDANDTILGTGARTLYIEGLDSDYNIIGEIISLNGLTVVTTSNSYLRVYRGVVLTSGTNSASVDANIGTININGADTSTLLAQIKSRMGQTLMSPYTIPAGKTGYITGASFSTGQGKQCLFLGKIRNAEAPEGAFSVKYSLDVYEQAFIASFNTPLRVPEKTDMCFVATTTSGTIEVSVSYGIILIDN